MNRSTIITLFLLLFLAGSGCKKCYDCTKKCGTCQKSGYSAVAGCQGDTTLHGLSVEAWKVYYESNGYTCAYSNAVESVCGTDNKTELSNKYYECISK